MMLQKQQLLLPTAHTVPTTYNTHTHTHTHFFLPQPPPKSSNPQVKTKGEARMSTAALAYTYNNNNNTGGGGAKEAAAAFTNAQWRELERQAMIYKYMVASVPVPPHLISSDLSASIPLHNHGYSSLYNLKFGNKKDAEPGRCNRTDGKKWRCSRDVAPHQKYCERHMHRGRPRSRKPVEPLQLSAAATKKTRPHLPSNGSASTTAPPPPPMAHELDDNPSAFLLKDVGKAEDVSLSLFTQHSNRDLNWMMESKMVTMDTSEQQWHQLMSESSIYSATNTSNFQHNNYGEAEQLNLLSIPEIGNSEADKYESYLNPYYTSKNFIDAWSNSNNLNKNESSGAVVNENDSPSSLNLSMTMAVSDSYDSEMCQIQMGECHDANRRCQGLSWLSPVSWMSSAPGGPLAEVLRPLSVDVNSIPGCHYAGNSGDAIGPLATSASSPTGVLQRTMLSLSDSSVCNSPTVAAISTAAPEIVGFQWLN